ncbi:MAG: phosphate ABC transporter permease subunit PstC [Chloroflexi bacterium]|nr:MAG: phosphate ABC transporter permease subunit PstC [Chloroflexota bacterium]
MSSRYFVDRSSKAVVVLCALASFLVLLAIGVFTLREAMPAFGETGVLDFLFGTTWRPGQDAYGILPMMVGSIYVAFLAMAMAVPLGIACAILLAEVAPRYVRRLLRPAVELLVGIPSVVYGLVGMVIIVPQVRHLGGSGYSVLAAAIVLMAMCLPTIISISEDSIRAVPRSYKEGSLALGATQWQTMWRVTLPAARSGLIAAVILGIGRAIGETMAVYMVIGNAILMPVSPLDKARTLTGNIAVEITYAAGIHEKALFATGVVLFLLILVINSVAILALKRGVGGQRVG